MATLLPDDFRDLTGAQRDIMYSLAFDGPASGKEVFTRVGGGPGPENRSSTYPMLKDLAARGLVEVEPRDDRENEYRLTAEGDELVERVLAVLR